MMLLFGVQNANYVFSMLMHLSKCQEYVAALQLISCMFP